MSGNGTDESLIRFPRYRDGVSVGQIMSVEMPVADWLALVGWGLGIPEDIPHGLQVIYSQVMQQILHPAELKERIAHQKMHEEASPVTILQNLAARFTNDPRFDDGPDLPPVT